MTRERLAYLRSEDLFHLAEIFGVEVDDDTVDERFELEEVVFEAMEEARSEQDDEDPFPIHYHQRRFESVEELFGQALPGSQNSFQFPESYNVTRIELMLRDPAWAFAYWDISLLDKSRFLKEERFTGFALRLEELNAAKPREDLHIMDIPVNFTDSSWYLNLQNRETRYIVHLLAIFDNREETIASSWPVRVPHGGLSSKLDILESFETDALISLSGIEKLGVAEMPAEIPHRILAIKDRWED